VHDKNKKVLGGNLLIKNGIIVYPEGFIKADILIEEGIIKVLGRDLIKSDPSYEVIDATNKLIFPGIIDEHVHFREPGLEYKDNIENGSKAAAIGGVTTVFDMPNTVPPVTDPSTFKQKADIFSLKSYVDYGLYAVLLDSNLHEIPSLIKMGAIGLKCFLGPTTGNLPSPNIRTIYEAMELSAKIGFPIAFHAEEREIIELLYERTKALKEVNLRSIINIRPPITEELAIRKIALIARHTGGKAIILHISSRNAIDALKEEKLNGTKIYAETCPHYLLFQAEDYQEYGSLIKVYPPIRERHHREALINAIKIGLIDTLGSDHAPHTVEEKMNPDPLASAAGIIGVQTLFPLMLDMALKEIIPLTKLPLLLSRNPAKIFGIYPKKGEIQVGSYGDIVIIDPNKETVISRENLVAKYPISPYIGWKLKGKIIYTIIRGEIIAYNGEIISKRPKGILITRKIGEEESHDIR
jgi:dihydroorotase